jgi:hypothetical protein
VSLDNQWWHIVWTTFQGWPPKDLRGDWRALANLYTCLADSSTVVEMSDSLPVHWQCRPMRDGSVRLSPSALYFLANDLHDLVSSDRVAGGTLIHALALEPISVQLLISCPTASMNQRVGRLKSRTATLLSFRKELGIGGKGTWGKGFWWARIPSEATFHAVENFMTEASGPHDLSNT